MCWNKKQTQSDIGEQIQNEINICLNTISRKEKTLREIFDTQSLSLAVDKKNKDQKTQETSSESEHAEDYQRSWS